MCDMGSWKNHVRTQLQQRDFKEKRYAGVFTSWSQLEERLEIRKQIWEDIQHKSLKQSGDEKDIRDLQLQLRESEHLAHKLSQTVSELTTVLYFKEAELQYLQSRVSQYHQEALTLAEGKKNLKGTLYDLEFTVECQSRELAAQNLEQTRLKEALEKAHTDQEQLLQRWIEEKKKEADKMNKYHDKKERQHVARQLKKHLQRDRGKDSAPADRGATNSARRHDSVSVRSQQDQDVSTGSAF